MGMDLSKLSDAELDLADKLAGWTKDKFTQDQFNTAKKVRERALANGLNPDFVLPMVMQESGFKNSSKSNKGAVGVMQVMPDTAETYKCDNPHDEDQNIECGMTILKDLMSKPNIGGDPHKVLAGYNAGPNSKFVKTGELKDLSDETLNHIDAVSNFAGGELPSNLTVDAVDKPAPVNMGKGKPVANNPVAAQPLDPLFGAGAGAAVGAGMGTTAALADAKIKVGTEAWDKFLGNKTPDVVTPEVAPATVTEPTPSPVAANQTKPAITPKHGGENWTKSLTGVDIPGAQMGKEDLDAAKLMQRTVGRNGAPGYTGGKITEGGIILSPQEAQAVAQKSAQASQAEQLAENARLMRQAQTRIALQRAEQSKAAQAAMMAQTESQAAKTAASTAENASPVWNYVKRLSGYPLKGALAGAGLGFSAVDVANRLNQGDKTGAALSGLGGAAGALGTFVGSAGALPALSIAAPLYNAASDRIEYLKKHPEAFQRADQDNQYDAMGNVQR